MTTKTSISLSRRPRRWKSGVIGAVLTLALVAALVPASASASTIHTFTLDFEPLVGGHTFSKPRSVAADAAGNLYVIGDGGCQEVTKWDVNGTPVDFSAFGTNSTACGSSFSNTSQIAVAPPGSLGGTAGNIYFTSKTGVEIYAADGTHIGQITEAAGSAFGAFKEGPCGVAVDPSGKVYVGDDAGRIVRFVPSANPPTNADYDAQITGVGRVCNVAADSHGDVYASTASIVDEGILKSVNGPLTKYPAAQFGGAGSGTQITAESAGVGVDPTNDDVYVTEPVSDQIAQFDSAGNLLVKFGEGHLNEPRGVAVDTAGDVFVSSKNGSNPGWVSIFAAVLPPEPPSVSEEGATDVNTTNAILRGQLDPNREATTYHFEYTDHADFVANGFANAISKPLPEASVGSGNVVLPVFQPVTGLAPDTTYDFRLVATNGSGTTPGLGSTFTTYSSSPVFGPCPNDALRIGPSTALPDCRAYELVSPLEKSGSDIGASPVIAAADGGAAVFLSAGSFAGAPAGAFPSTYAAGRADAWRTHPLNPPTDPVFDHTSGQVLGFSGDFEKQLVLTDAKLTPEAVGGDSTAVNIYVHDSVTGSYQYVGTAYGQGLQPQNDILFGTRFLGASHDGSVFFFQVGRPLDSTPAPPGGTGVYEYDVPSHQLNLVGVLPDGSVFPGETFDPRLSLGVGNAMSFHAVSDDGRRVFWEEEASLGNIHLYLREDGQSTLVSRRYSDGSAAPAQFWGASSDGSVALLTSKDKLTADASPADADLYRYDANSDQLTDLTSDPVDPSGAAVREVLGMSEDGAYVYFVANGAIAPGASVGSPNVYAWHEGETRLVATLGAGDPDFFTSKDSADFWRVSPNGRYLGLLYSGQLIGPHPEPAHPYREAYLYDHQEDSLVCVSCLPGGGDPSADITLHSLATFIGINTGSLVNYKVGLTRNITDAGQFFFQSADRLVAADSNGRQDVYEYEDGHVYLISSGHADTDSYFGDATPSGSDAFFITREKGLVGEDHDNLLDLYDARVNGGLGDAASAPDCAGDACAVIASPPSDQSPASESYRGPDSVTKRSSGSHRKRCGKARKQRRGRCVRAGKRHRKHAGRTGNANRGGSK